MGLRRFNIIVAIDSLNGIGKDGKIPWHNKDDMKHFKETTIGNGKNAVIMGRKTYESIPEKFRPLSNRRNIVITSKDIPDVDTVSSLEEALSICRDNEQVFVIGGKMVYDEAINNHMDFCDGVYISHIPGDYECDMIFPYPKIICRKNTRHKLLGEFNNLTISLIETFNIDSEMQYLHLLSEILQQPVRSDRTGTGTRSLAFPRMEFDLRKGFPLFTTKRVWFTGIMRELLFFLSGSTDSKKLESQKVNIWKNDTSKQNLEKKGLSWKEGDMGPSYGFQWRYSGTEYNGCDVDYTGKGVDQIQKLITGLKEDPFSRRHILTSWVPKDIDTMALPPCHCFLQLYVGCDENNEPTYLDALMHQRSADMFLGVPFNVASYALLIHMIGHITGLIPRRFVHSFGDAHIYINHVNQVKEQISRSPKPLPTISFAREIDDIDDFTEKDIILSGYQCWPTIKGEMSF